MPVFSSASQAVIGDLVVLGAVVLVSVGVFGIAKAAGASEPMAPAGFVFTVLTIMSAFLLRILGGFGPWGPQPPT